MKSYIKNVILVMSGGTGSRFGADAPKQYCTMENRLVIDYVMDACRKSKKSDAIVIVAAGDYIDFCHERFEVPVVVGGQSRPESVANGIKYVHDNYDCEKLIITNAVCPLATSEQYDRYFDFLDKYDYVLTTWKLAPALHKFDGERVDRDDFFNVMEPDAYRFKKLYSNFDFENMHKYIFHNMPLDSKPMFCFDYPYTMKLTYRHDLKLLKVLYDEIIVNPEKERTLQVVNNYLSADGRQGVSSWVCDVQGVYIEDIAHKYDVTSYSINSQTEANIVYEAQSSTYGNIIIKFTPSDFHFHKEYMFYKLSGKDVMAECIGFDKEYNAIILKMVKPGYQVKFDSHNPELRAFFDRVNEDLIPEECVKGDKLLPTVMGEFEEYVRCAGRFTHEEKFRKIMEDKAREIWYRYFEKADKFFLHRDLHRRNILKAPGEELRAIDPRGAVGPRAFEYVIPFIIELREYDHFNEEKYNEMFEYFTKYVSAEELRAALFIFWVYKMNDYVFQKNDNYKLANWCKECILCLYFAGVDENTIIDSEPEGLTKNA